MTMRCTTSIPRPLTRFTGALVALTLTAAGFSAFANAQDAKEPRKQEHPRRVLLDTQGRMRVIRLIRLTDQEIVYEDALGRRRHAAVGGVAALAPATDAAPIVATPAPASVRQSPGAHAPATALKTTNGQRFPGRLEGTAAGDDSVVWAHPAFGPIEIPLDRVASAILRAAGATAMTRRDPGRTEPEDELLLVNGDRLTGFLLGLGDPVEIEGKNGVVDIEADRVAAVRLANPSAPMRGLVVWLQDGTIAVVASLATRDDGDVEVQLPTGQAAVYPLGDVRAVAFEAGRLISLAAIATVRQAPVGDRPWTAPVQVIARHDSPAGADLSLSDIVLPGPMVVEYKLPEATARFVAIAEMPVEDRDWGDCTLIVRVDGVERFRARLNRDSPRVEINTPARGQTLTFEIDPGLYGPIHDIVVLRRPALLLESASIGAG